MYGSLNRVNAQNAKAKLSDSYNKLLREITSSSFSTDSASILEHQKTIGNYSIIRLIGTGSFGKVYLAVHKFTRTKVVLKSSSKDQPNLVREIHHHRQFKHPHIARLYEIIVTETLVWMALEYCPGDELYTYLVTHGRLKEDEVKKIFSELVGAVAYTHSKNCTHRDIKLENTLLDKRHNVKLCDFGFTREYEHPSRNLLETVCGTTCYMAPEMLIRKKYSGEAVDVWSLGVILYTLLYGEMPFEEETELDTKMKIINEEPKFIDRTNGDVVSPGGAGVNGSTNTALWWSVPDVAHDLVKSLLSKDPKLRPSLLDILNHPYLEEFASIQRTILATKEPKVFSTKAEKKVLRSLKAANFDLGYLVDSVVSQSCDSLAGLWALAVEKQIKLESSKRPRRSSLGIKLPKREESGATLSLANGNNSTTHTITLPSINAEGIALPRRFGKPNELQSPDSPRSPDSPFSPLGRLSSSLRSSVEPEVRRQPYNDTHQIVNDNTSANYDAAGGISSSAVLLTDSSKTKKHIVVNPSVSVPILSTPHALPLDSNTLGGLSGLTLSVSSLDKDQPSMRSTRSSILERTKTKASSATRDIKISLKTTMMRLMFGNIKKRQSDLKEHSVGSSTGGTTTSTLASSASSPRNVGISPKIIGASVGNGGCSNGGDVSAGTASTDTTATAGIGLNNSHKNPNIIIHNDDEDRNNDNDTCNDNVNANANKNDNEDDDDSNRNDNTSAIANDLSYNSAYSGYYSDTAYDSLGRHALASSPFKATRPISQISQFSQISAFSQLSQYSVNSQISSAPSQMSQERNNSEINQTNNITRRASDETGRRPKYTRRSTSSSFSSLISRHRKTHSKASSTSSASLNSSPNSPRRVSSPILGGSAAQSHSHSHSHSHSPFPRRNRGRFNESAVFSSSIPSHHQSNHNAAPTGSSSYFGASGSSSRRQQLRRKSPFASVSYARGSASSSSRKQSTAATSSKVIEDVEEEGDDVYEDIDDDRGRDI